MNSRALIDAVSDALAENFIAQFTSKNGTTNSVVGFLIDELKDVYGDEELLEVSMDEAQTAVSCIETQSELNDLTIDAIVAPKMEFKESSFPLVWLLLKIRPNRDKKIKKKTLKVERYITQKKIGLEYYTGCKEIVQEWGDAIQQYWNSFNESTTCDISQSPSYRIVQEDEQIDMSSQNGAEEDTRAKAIYEAFLAVMDRKDSAGNYIFHLQSQWEGIYLVLKIKQLYTGLPKDFHVFLRNLGLADLRLALPNKNVTRNHLYGKVLSIDTWFPQGASEIRIHEVAKIFNEELEKRLPKI